MPLLFAPDWFKKERGSPAPLREKKIELQERIYNDHVRLLSPEPFWLAFAPPTLLGPRSRHCYGIITLIYHESKPFSYGSLV